MARRIEAIRETGVEGPSEISLVTGIVHDAEKLVKYGVQLAKIELQEEWKRRKAAGIAYAIGASTFVVALVFVCVTLAHLLNSAGVPLWGSYAIVAALLFAAGAVSVTVGKRKMNRPKEERHGTGT